MDFMFIKESKVSNDHPTHSIGAYVANMVLKHHAYGCN